MLGISQSTAKEGEQVVDIGKEFSRLGVAAKKKKASERFSKVRELRKQGLSAPQILEILNTEGADWKLRTIYADFKKIKQVEAAEARAPKKIAYWFEIVDSMRRHSFNPSGFNRTLSQNIEILNSQGFNIDPRVVSGDYDKLKQEVEKSIHLDIHDNIREIIAGAQKIVGRTQN